MVISAGDLEFYCHCDEIYFVYSIVPASGCFGFRE